ncbi:hypothetical protein J6590_050175 [Homalodisca vitripennis]|nr:hypothetical protein J6590_050175 [Homalodisca vitripennis]
MLSYPVQGGVAEAKIKPPHISFSRGLKSHNKRIYIQRVTGQWTGVRGLGCGHTMPVMSRLYISLILFCHLRSTLDYTNYSYLYPESDRPVDWGAESFLLNVPEVRGLLFTFRSQERVLTRTWKKPSFVGRLDLLQSYFCSAMLHPEKHMARYLLANQSCFLLSVL